MKLAAEKNLNKFAFPVMSLKGKPITYPFKVSYGPLAFGCGAGIFGPRNWMLMDVLGTYHIHKTYNSHEGKVEFIHKIPTPRSHQVKYASGLYMSFNLLKFVTEGLSGRRDGSTAAPAKRRVQNPRPLRVSPERSRSTGGHPCPLVFRRK